jgi:hypothetical protein
MKVPIVIVDPPGWGHGAIFSEMAELLGHGFQKAGHAASAAINETHPTALNVVLAGFNLTPPMLDALPRRTVFYNLEQVEDALFDWMPSLKPAYARFEVWDYSLRNIQRLRPHAPVIHHLPIGTVPELTRIRPAPVQDIDVLFYGSDAERRRAAFDSIREAGLNLHTAFGVYGEARDALIARSKVVLNLHKHDAAVFELVRVSYLLANRKAVVTELSPTTEIDPDLADAVCGVPYEGLAQACRRLVDDDAARLALEQQAFARMTARNEVFYIRKLLNQRQKVLV